MKKIFLSIETSLNRIYLVLYSKTKLFSEEKKISLNDISNFAEFTGDKFYAHMDEEAAKQNPFFPGRVAHGYLLVNLSFYLLAKWACEVEHSFLEQYTICSTHFFFFEIR